MYIYIVIYIIMIFINNYLENRMNMFFLSIMGFTRNGRFFCSIAFFLVFDCEGLFKSFDNTVFGHPPTVSKRGISVQSGANWES